MKNTSIILFLTFCSCFLIACESETNTIDLHEQSNALTKTLFISDSIGIEMGDSAFVFGAIADVEILPDGNIIVLDGTYCNLKIFTRLGEHVLTMSGRGDAPGELSHPFDLFNWGDGTVGVIDPYHGGLHRFSLEGEWLGIDLDIHREIHSQPIVVADSEFVSFKPRFDVDGDVVYATAMISRFPISEEPIVSYWQETVLWDPTDMGNIALELLFSNSFTANQVNGRTYVAPFSEDNYIIYAFTADGEEIGTITKEYLPVPKTPDEIQEEIDFIAFTLGAGEEGNPDLNYICEPWPNHLPITGLFVDSEGNLWVRQGGTDIPTFDIWNEDLELIASATIPEFTGDGSTLSMVFGDDFIVAWDENPEFFQKLYFLEIN